MFEDKEWSEILETIYLAFSRIADGFIEFLNGIFGKDAE